MFFTKSTTCRRVVTSAVVYCLIAGLTWSAGMGMLFFDGHNHLGPDSKARPAAKPVKAGLKIRTDQKTKNTAAVLTSHQPVPVAPATNNQVNRAIPRQQANYGVTAKAKNTQTGSYRYSPVPESDLPLLARIIHAEAGGESLRGQVAVGAVLLNRIRSGRFPKNLAANIFRPGEFESVSNGYIWSEPTAASYQAARLAMQGWDPTYGALYFFNPAKSTSSWIWSRQVNIVIGQHYFAG
ncbi:MAG: cell wall hydrolase [Bacillota bacterium]